MSRVSWRVFSSADDTEDVVVLAVAEDVEGY
jgi:hypothetical protein